MVKRKQYEDTKFHFITTTDPYVAPSKDVQTFIRRQAMKDAGIQRRIRNKQRREKSLSAGGQTPPDLSWNMEKSIPRHMPAVILDNVKPGQNLMVPSSDLHQSLNACAPLPSPSYGWASGGISSEEDPEYPAPFLLPQTSSYTLSQRDPFGIFPIAMDGDTHRIFDFAIASLERLPNIRRWWLQAGFEDASMFRQKLSISAQLLGLRKGKGGQKELELSWNLSHLAIADVNLKLQNPVESISNGVLSTILGLTYGRLDSKFVLGGWWIHLAHASDWAPHLAAAHTIIAKRGGVDNINSPALRQEIYWIDLIASAHQDDKPRYPLPEGITLAFQNTLDNARRAFHHWSGFLYARGLEHVRPILDKLDDMKCIIGARRNECMGTKLEPWQDGGYTADWINPMTHQLFQLFLKRPIQRDKRQWQAFEALRLAFLLYTFALRALPGNNPRPPTIQDQKLKNILRDSETGLWPELPELGLWVLGVLSLSYNNEHEKLWLCSEIREMAHSMNIFTTEHLLSRLYEIAWEEEFSRVLLDSVLTTPREIIDITEQPVETSYFEIQDIPVHTPSMKERYYFAIGQI